MATFNLGNQIQIVNPVANVDSNYGPYTGATLQDALTLAHNTIGVLREIGLTVGIKLNGTIVEYWYKSGKDNVSDLVLKQSSTSVPLDLYTAYSVLINNANVNSPEALNIPVNSVLGRVLGNIQSVLIDNDLSSVSTTDDTLASAKAIKDYIDQTVSSAFIFQGGYNAFSNTPNLDNWTSNPQSGILTGWTYIVTTQGLFFTTSVQVGDHVIANVDNPLTLSDWTIVDNSVSAASETVTGIIRIATQSEVSVGTSGVTAVTPLSLKTLLGITSDKSIPRKYIKVINSTSDNNTIPYPTSYTITHGIGNQDVVVKIRDTVYPYYEVEAQITIPTINTIVIDFTLPPDKDKYSITIIG